MKSLLRFIFDFSELDRQIDKLKGLRDSYYQENVRHYGKAIAELLNDPLL